MAVHGLTALPFWLALAGVGLAYVFYMVKPEIPAAIHARFGFVYRLLENKYYMDWINERLLAPAARGVGLAFWKGGDVGLIDGVAINGSAFAIGGIARLTRLVQTGHLYWYALVMLLGVFGLLTWPSVAHLATLWAAERGRSTSMGLLSVAIWLPIGFGLLLFALGRDQNANAVRWVALIGAVAGLLVTLPLISGFDIGTAAMQFQENLPWIGRFNVRYRLGIDGISMWFVPLTAFMTLVVVIAGWEVITDRVAHYMGAFLILSGLMIGVFSALDGLLFYVFFEATLIPMYIIIGIWGGPKRVYAAFKFFLYTLAGSLLMLVALTYLYYKSGGSFDILTWHKLPLRGGAQTWLFFAFLAAFSVKVPMWPVHTWLPDVHVEAPTGGSVPFWRPSCSNWVLMAFCRFLACPSLPDAIVANGPG